MIFDDRSKDPLGVGDIVAIVDAELEVDASSRLGRHVREDVPPDLVVGHDQGLVVDRQDRGRDETHMTDLAENTTRAVDPVAHIEGPIDEDHHARREVSERILKSEAENEADDSEPGRHRRDFDAQLREGDEEADHEDRAGREGYEHAFQEVGET